VAFVNYHPVYLALEGKPVLIVGAGPVGLEKLESLLPTGARITVIAPEAREEIQAWHREGRITYLARTFKDEDIHGFFMVVAATNFPAVNHRVFELGNALNVLSNSADDPDNCNFIMAAITRQGPMQAAVSSAGCSPALAQRVRRKIANDLLTPEVGELCDFLGSWRPRVKECLEGFKVKQAFWESVLDSDIPKILEQSGRHAANEAMETYLTRYASGGIKQNGKVTLVGAGPGDPDLMTVKGLNALEAADVVLYDRLTNPMMLKKAKASAVLVDVGKARGECGKPRQEMIHALMIEHARRGKKVVRLKGGDPFVFGRGGEEVLALRESGIAYEVIPGISSAIAAPSAAEIPVTHRGMATGFAVFTAHGASNDGADDDVDTVPWDAVRQMPTVVLLMGVERLPEIVKRLLESGRSPEVPIAVISHATLPTQQTVIGTLANIVQLGARLPSPATIVIGEVVKNGWKPVSELVESSPHFGHNLSVVS
jgi:uroporphyrin-III C-methyltransferase/precorrin-2 dehydrogenase/sirohydrochlorin ferrochelatase